jgi:hypothetical protein
MGVSLVDPRLPIEALGNLDMGYDRPDAVSTR